MCTCATCAEQLTLWSPHLVVALGFIAGIFYSVDFDKCIVTLSTKVSSGVIFQHLKTHLKRALLILTASLLPFSLRLLGMTLERSHLTGEEVLIPQWSVAGFGICFLSTYCVVLSSRVTKMKKLRPPTPQVA